MDLQIKIENPTFPQSLPWEDAESADERETAAARPIGSNRGFVGGIVFSIAGSMADLRLLGGTQGNWSTDYDHVEKAHRDFRSVLADEIKKYRELVAGWDGESSVVPSKEAIDDALAFIDAIPPNARILRPMVAGDGEVGFYRRSADAYFDIGFTGNGHIDFYARARGREFHGNRVFDRKSVPPDLLMALLAS